MGTTEEVVVLLEDDDEPTCSIVSTNGAQRHKRNKISRSESSEVVDLTSPSNSKKADLDVQVVKTRGIRKKKRAKAGVEAACRAQLPDVFIAKDDSRKKSSESGAGQLECRICIDKLKQPAATPCGHVFCHECIKRSFRVKKQCPICRKSIRSLNQIHRLYL